MKKRNNIVKRILALTCVATMMLTACGKNSDNGNDIPKVDAPVFEQTMGDKEIESGYMDFSINLFKESLAEGSNTLVSPISVIYALDMLTVGCEDETKEEILEMLCPGASMEDLVVYAEAFKDKFDGKSKFHLANSVWANEDRVKGKLNPEFIAILDKYMDAEAEMLPFNDEALEKINSWTNDATEEMIPEIIDYIPDNAVLYLVNAMAFDGKWDKPYEEYEIDEYGIFVNGNGEEENAKMLNSKEEWYIESNDATGFIKYYAGGDFAFVAILPNDDSISIDEYVSNMTGDDYKKLLKSKTDMYDVYASIPCFKTDYSITLNDPLMNLGMERAFDEDKAQFKTMADLGEGHNIFVNRVLHKTFIELNEKGTKAGAATAIEMTDKMAIMPDEEKFVMLNRPFAYAIVDMNTKLPIMLGTINTLEGMDNEAGNEVAFDDEQNEEQNEDIANDSIAMDGTLGQNLLDEFNSIASDDSLSTQDVADKLLESKLIDFAGASMPVEEGYLNGFGNAEITGFEEATMFAPMIGSIPFVGYVFEVNDDVDNFMELLKTNADPRWNVCTEADETVIDKNGKFVFFLMCPMSLDE